MPDCHWLLKFGYCSAGDECLYYHPHTKKRICEDYTRGFCYYGAPILLCATRVEMTGNLLRGRYVSPIRKTAADSSLPLTGPACPRRHIPSTLCPLYAAGFCPAGPTCPQGHPKPRPPLPEAYRPASPPSETPPGPPPPGYGRWAEWDPKVVQARFGGGPLGGAAGGGPGGPGGPGGRDMSGVLCFKCGQKGHFANLSVTPLALSNCLLCPAFSADPILPLLFLLTTRCPNRNVPGNRGGLDRTGLPIPK